MTVMTRAVIEEGSKGVAAHGKKMMIDRKTNVGGENNM